VGRRVGNAVARNRVKRLLREAARALHPRLRDGHDLVLIARPVVAPASLVQVARALGAVVERAHLLREPSVSRVPEVPGGAADVGEEL